MESFLCKYKVNDLVFAKSLDNHTWPGKVSQKSPHQSSIIFARFQITEVTSSPGKYAVLFFANSRTALVERRSIYPYNEKYIRHFVTAEALKNLKNFKAAIHEIEEEAKKKQSKSPDESSCSSDLEILEGPEVSSSAQVYEIEEHPKDEECLKLPAENTPETAKCRFYKPTAVLDEDSKIEFLRTQWKMIKYERYASKALTQPFDLESGITHLESLLRIFPKVTAMMLLKHRKVIDTVVKLRNFNGDDLPASSASIELMDNICFLACVISRKMGVSGGVMR